MAKKTEKWREFEQLVAKIYTQATPEANVKHNYFIEGKSGRRRQIDVSIESSQGLHSYLTVVECKRYARRVGIRDVEAFITKIQDVRADKGVMVSIVGFDEGAQAQARQYNITLFSYRDAKQADWHKIAASSIWITFTTEEFRPEYMIAQLADGGTVLVKPTESLCTEDEQVCFTGLELAGSMIEHHPFLANVPEAAQHRAPGPMWIEGRISTTVGPFFLTQNGQVNEIDRITLQGDMVVFTYSVNPAFESGHVIENALTGQQPYTEVSSLPFSVESILRSQEGRGITKEEYQANQGLRIFLPPEVSADSTQLRLTITAPSGGS